jgi:shikimate 5-dehydrogenase
MKKDMKLQNPESQREPNTVEELLGSKMLEFSKQALGNPDKLHPGNNTIFLYEEDYPIRSTVMWNAVYKELGLPYQVTALIGQTKNAPLILGVLKQDKTYKGGGLGVGWKDEAVKGGLLDEIDPLAAAMGAVNFVVKTPEGKLKGFNTDGAGYFESLKEVLGKSVKDLKIVLISSGGTANAIAFKLKEQGARLVILNRTVDKAEALAGRINAHFKEEGQEPVRFGGLNQIPTEIKDADVVINATTIGAAGDFEKFSPLVPIDKEALEAIEAKKQFEQKNPNEPLSQELKERLEKAIARNHQESQNLLRSMKPEAIVSDVVLVLGKTPLLELAEKEGYTTLDGIPMVINQAVEAFWLLHQEELKNIFPSYDEQKIKEQIRLIMKQSLEESS